jgi:hypothetical protein
MVGLRDFESFGRIIAHYNLKKAGGGSRLRKRAG